MKNQVYDNKIFYVAKEEIEKLKEHLATVSDTYVVELEGADIQTEREYVWEIDTKLQVPYDISSRLTLGWYHDDITDCTWIEEKHIILIIRHFDDMLKNCPKVKQNIIDEFNSVTLPWWGGEIIGHMVGGEPKEFLVYLEVEK